jgi:hypothetical protein
MYLTEEYMYTVRMINLTVMFIALTTMYAGDQPQFDPGVLTEGDKTYLFTGFCGHDDKTRIGATAVTLGKDMLILRVTYFPWKIISS